jgi:hypothetical protein
MWKRRPQDVMASIPTGPLADAFAWRWAAHAREAGSFRRQILCQEHRRKSEMVAEKTPLGQDDHE